MFSETHFSLNHSSYEVIRKHLVSMYQCVCVFFYYPEMMYMLVSNACNIVSSLQLGILIYDHVVCYTGYFEPDSI